MSRSLLLTLLLLGSSFGARELAGQNPIIYTVTALGDAQPSAAGTLRRALESADADGRASRVQFAPALFGATIFLVRPLPTLREGQTELDGSDGATPTPRITLTPAGGQAPQIGSPLRLESSGNLIRGLTLIGFQYINLQVVGGVSNRLQDLVIQGGNTGVSFDGCADSALLASTITAVSGVAVEVLRSQRCVLGPGVEISDPATRAIDIDASNSAIEVRSSTVRRGGAVGIRCFAPASILAGNLIELSQGAGIQVEAAGCSVRDNRVLQGRAMGVLVRNVPAGVATEIGPGNLVEGNALHGIQLQSAPRVVVRDNLACRDNGLSGIRLDGSTDVVIRDNAAIDRNLQDGIAIYGGSHRARVERCVVNQCASDGIDISGSDDVIAESCTVSRSVAHAVYVLGSARARIGPGNQLRDAGGAGVLVDLNASSCVVEGSAISRPQSSGIVLLGNQARADGNTIDAPGEWGVRVQGAGGCGVARNTIRDAGLDGISVYNTPLATPTLVGPSNLVERSALQGLSLASAPGTRVEDNLGFRSNRAIGVQVFDCPGARLLRNAEIASNTLLGIALSGQSGGTLVEGNTVRANGLDAVDVGAFTGFVFRGNTVRDHANSGLVVRGATGSLIESNRFLDNGSTAIIMVNGSNGTRVLRNEICGNFTGIGEGYNLGNEFGWNRIHAQLGSALCLSRSDAWVHDNLIWDNGLAGIETESGGPGALLVHNTVVGNGIGFFGDAAIWNSIFAGNGVDWFPFGAASCFGSLIQNDLFGVVGTNGNFSADPELICIPAAAGLLRDPLHISNRSPCRDRAHVGAPRLATTDIDGEPRPAGSAADVGADEAGRALDAIPPFLSQQQGGVVQLSLLAPSARAGHLVLVLGSISGTGPIALGGVLLPLSYDVFFVLTLELAATPLLPGFVGVLDAGGRHGAQFVVSAGLLPPELIGVVNFSFAWLDITSFDFASNATCVEIVP